MREVQRRSATGRSAACDAPRCRVWARDDGDGAVDKGGLRYGGVAGISRNHGALPINDAA